MENLALRKYMGDGRDCLYRPFMGGWITKEVYIASPKLVEAVNIALSLRRPLLLQGEPGCGKTRLAYSVAYELGYPLKECYIRSTTQVKDLLYTYDATGRLYDIEERQLTGSMDKVLPSRKEYVTLGKLGEAIRLSQEDIPSVVLIDEIDKADIDFPNDLLLVIDRLAFEIHEARWEAFDALKGQTIEERKAYLPLIIITNNEEKELPKSFMRRCLVHHIEFPSYERLKHIIALHFSSLDLSMMDLAISQFIEIRNQVQNEDMKLVHDHNEFDK